MEPGNIDLLYRPQVRNPDGSTSTVRSVGVGLNGKETLLPTITDDGRTESVQQAIARYLRTGKHLGRYDSVDEASRAAQQLHKDQELMYGDPEILRLLRRTR